MHDAAALRSYRPDLFSQADGNAKGAHVQPFDINIIDTGTINIAGDRPETRSRITRQLFVINSENSRTPRGTPPRGGH